MNQRICEDRRSVRIGAMLIFSKRILLISLLLVALATIPVSTRSLLEGWNQDGNERGRYDAVVSAPQNSLFQVLQ